MYTLMIVDDSNIIRNKICSIQMDSPFHVVATARNGAEAVNLYQEFRPECVTMDLTMPHMDGLECIPLLRILNPKVRILVISAISDKSTAIKALKLGAKGFLPKPFEDTELMRALNLLVK